MLAHSLWCYEDLRHRLIFMLRWDSTSTVKAGSRSRKVALLLPVSAALVEGCALPTSSINEQGTSQDADIAS